MDKNDQTDKEMNTITPASIGSENQCGCLCCQKSRRTPLLTSLDPLKFYTIDPIRYACELCGNKRCPHHIDHRLKCTNSNDTGQVGSAFT